MHDRAADYQRHALTAGQAAGLRPGSRRRDAACPGSNETTRTHASALWAADYALNAAQLGITRIGFHSSLLTCKGGPPMSAICSGGAYPSRNGEMSGRANFFGMSMVAELEAGKFLKLDSTGGGLAYSYALQNADGSTSVVIVNKNDPEKAAQTQVTLELPGQAADRDHDPADRAQLRGRGQHGDRRRQVRADAARRARHGGGLRVRVRRRRSSS